MRAKGALPPVLRLRPCLCTARPFFVRAAGLLAGLAFFAGSLDAQEITARLEIMVEDAEGRPVPGASVRLVRGAGRTPIAAGETDDAGVLALEQIPPCEDGLLLITAPGRGPIASGPVPLESGRLDSLVVVLPPAGEGGEEVVIEPIRRTVDTTDPRTGEAFGSTSLSRVALLGRFYADVLTLAPGVTDPDQDGRPTVQGSRETGLQHRLDGADVTDPVSGLGGMNLNFEIFEEVSVSTAGAGASAGRSDGGFANLVTKSGGNDFQVALRLTWRDALFEDDPSGAYEDTFVRAEAPSEDLNELRTTLMAGGPIRRDRLWYFVSAHSVESSYTETSTARDLTQRGWSTLTKLSWQLARDHRVSLSLASDPRRFDGVFDAPGVSRESGATWKQGGTSLQGRWSWIVQPNLIVESGLSRTESGIEIDPDSSLFHEIDLSFLELGGFLRPHPSAFLPTKECSTDGTAAGFIPNCDPSNGRTSIYQIDLVNGGATGPLWFRREDHRRRVALRSDVTFVPEGGGRRHFMRGGVEATVESFDDDTIYNPFFQNLYFPCTFCFGPFGQPLPNAVSGFKILTVPWPSGKPQGADGSNVALYGSDTWKPFPNLSVTAGLRFDGESLRADGYESFDPAAERRESIRVVEALCDDAVRVASTSGLSNAGAVCNIAGRIPGTLNNGNLIYVMDPLTPPSVRRYDVNGDGTFNSGADLYDGRPVWYRSLTIFVDRESERLEIDNRNWSPRIGIAWDPWKDGRTKVFSTWGRYYDRIFLGVAAHETEPVFVNFTFEPDPVTREFEEGSFSRSISSAGAFQVDRDLKTPHADVFTLGIEREVAPEWSIRATYVQRLAWDLLEDSDVNHLLCTEYDDVLGIDPALVCPGAVLPGGKVLLDQDLFGNPGTGLPNGVPDLYVLNPYFRQVLRVENSGSAAYKGLTLEAIRRPWRGWQLGLAYTWSKAEGEGSSFLSPWGDDPAGPRGPVPLDTDQRHRLVLHGTASLPRRTDIGWVVTWESGTPYSVTTSVADEDNLANVSSRTLYPTGEPNDQRNAARWIVDGRVRKGVGAGRVTAAVELAVKNLLGEENTTLSAFRASDASGPALLPGPDGLEIGGRTWEAGIVLSY